MAAAAPGQAQTTAEARTESATQSQVEGEDYHEIAPEIIVSARGVRDLDILAGTSVLQGDELQRNQSGQLGDVLAKLPGVTSSGFAPGASRPVLRGLSGERVRTLVDGIGTLDASNTSDDHAVAVDSLTTERIEVLRGPAVLLYGSQAIGGAVNVIDKRIPRRPLDEAFHFDALAGFDSVNDQYQIAGSLDVPLGETIVFHIDGSYRDAGDLSVPGFTIAEGLRADLLADAAEEEAEGELEASAELREAANQRDVLPNSYFEATSANAGFAIFAGESTLGASVGYYDTTYGIPGRPGAGHHHHGEEGEEEAGAEGQEEGEEQVSIGLERFRADLRAELALGDGLFERFVTRVGYTDYTHTEFEGSEVGTVFGVEGIEARAELVQNQDRALRGSTGIQYYWRDFQAIGAEAFVRPNVTDQFAVFTLQEFGTGPVQIEAALRYETTSVRSPALGVDREFDGLSGALGVSFQTDGGLRVGVNGTRVQRAPAGEELFANGPHIATQAFEIGDVNLSMEKAWGVEAFVRGTIGPARVNFAVSQSWFEDFIYLSPRGEEEGDLPVFVFLQDEADYFAIEGEINVPLVNRDGFGISVDLGGDYVRAELADGSPVPRIPPLRLLGALEARTGPLEGRVEVQHFFEQDRVAEFETPTDAFTFVSASLAWKPFGQDGSVTLLGQVENIFNVEGRRHTSFTKDFVPLPGRNFRVSARLSF
ncbi:TonB-dependent receptor [Qipengyuania sediminis]|uniref:TonB-dependent receptor n=1 Tax=Qipengyuania sediminis TaxID=1532023 RepID=UPI0030844A2F